MEQNVSWILQREPGPADTEIWDSWSPDLWGNKFLLFQGSQFMVLGYGGWLANRQPVIYPTGAFEIGLATVMKTMTYFLSTVGKWIATHPQDQWNTSGK